MYSNYKSSSRMHILIVSVMALAGSARATLIDDFLPVDHNQDLTFGGHSFGINSYVASFSGNMLGGERDVEIRQLTQSLGQAAFFARYDHNGGSNDPFAYRVGALGTGNSVDNGVVTLQYDRSGDEVNNTGFGKSLRNGGTGVPLLAGTDGGIRIWGGSRLAGGRSALGRVTLRSLGNLIGQSDQAIYQNDPYQPYLYPFAPNILGQADSITIQFFAPSRGDADYSVFIDRIDTITPEPSTLWVLGAAGIALAVRRRKRSKA